MSADKYPSIFSRQKKAVVYIYIYIYIYMFNIQSSFTVKNQRVRLVEIGHMTTLCVSIPQSSSAVIKSYKALQLLQLSIHSKTVQIFMQVLVMNSVPLI